MKDNKPWYEKISIWITIVAGICTILGLSVIGIMKGDAKSETTTQDIIDENADEFNDISANKNNNSDNNESFPDENNDEYQKLKNEYDQLLNEMENLTAENTNLKNENENIQNNLKELEYKNSELENDNIQLESENVQLKKNNELLENENTKLQNENTQLKIKVKDLEDKIDEIIGHNDSNDDQVSIFTLETFSGDGRWRSSTYSNSSFTDTYGNTYPSAYEAYHIWENSSTPHDPPVYLLDKKYSKCIGQLAWPKEQKDMEGRIWIEFYSDDELLYKTEKISAEDRVLTFEVNVENVEKLKIYRMATRPSVRAIYPYLTLIK